MNKKYFIGVDGGGTKSRLQIEDGKGNILAHTESGMASIRISVDRTWDSINQALAVALPMANIDTHDPEVELYGGFGLAGCELEEHVQDFLSRPHPFKELLLNSDGYTACLGAHECKDGAIVIIGTGIVGFEIIGHNILQTSGWGFPQGDEGAGAWLGLETVRRVSQWYDGRREGSPFLTAVFQRFDNDWQLFHNWSDKAESSDFGTLVPLLVEYIDKRDPNALELIQGSGREVDRIFYALQKKAGEHKDRIKYALFGGVAPYVQPWVCQELKSLLTERKHNATKGAIFMIRQHVLGSPFGEV